MSSKQGFLSFKQKGGDNINLFYMSRTRELFIYTNRECQVTDVKNPPEPIKSLIHEWRTWRQNLTILGPSALFARAWASQGKEL
ncbi:hypothetical protein MTO96_051738, partial [Rhipicephalus appendiculatus]